MSLSGSLKDLSVGDILQIVSLSQKSGVLGLRINDGDGRIVFRRGLVCGAVAKDGPSDLRSLLVAGGCVAEADFDAAETVARSEGRKLSEVLCETECVSAERLDSLRREAVEAAVVAMSRWRVGEFSFDVGEPIAPEDPQLLLPIGVNAESLAMEGARGHDEGDFDPGESAVDAEEMFGVDSDAELLGRVDAAVERALGEEAPLNDLEPLDEPAMTDDFEPPTPAMVDPIESVDRVESREALAQALCDPLANIGSATLQPSGSTRLPGEVLKGLNGSRDPRGSQGTAVHRILIVEDSETMRSLMMASLENLESPVKTAKAASGFEALRMLAREPYDLIVTDINMPDINGLELVWFVKRNEQYNSIPVIIVSTEGSERDRDKGLGLGADAYLVKPFDPAELHDVAAELLARASRW